MKKKLLPSCCLVLGVIAALSLAVGSALAQPGTSVPDANHYKVYEVTFPVPPVVVTGPITLIDQFGDVTISQMTLEKFAIPAEKHLAGTTGEVYPIIDPLLHYTWWAFQQSELVRRADVLDQFGGFSWRLRDSGYLLAPAAKNVMEIPQGNHYKCYQADRAPVVNITVGLVDQVDSVGVVVLQGEYFCNPVEKVFQGVSYPIVEPLLHMTCYRVDNTTAYDLTELTVDQFGGRTIGLGQNTYLCLPAAKGTVVETEPSTWGRIKAQYK